MGENPQQLNYGEAGEFMMIVEMRECLSVEMICWVRKLEVLLQLRLPMECKFPPCLPRDKSYLWLLVS